MARAWDGAQLVECLSSMHRPWVWVWSPPLHKPGGVLHAFDASPGEVEVQGLLDASLDYLRPYLEKLTNKQTNEVQSVCSVSNQDSKASLPEGN